MFVSQEHHPQILDRTAYTDAARLQQEMDTLLLPSWHAVAVMNELPRDGSYVTLELFGRPLILWRKDEEVHCFLNVCSHRFSRITGKEKGNCDRLHCQYHGWQFDKTGSIRKIPDARSFRPLKQGMLGLTKFRAERCGQLVFVSLATEGPSLREFLGEMFDTYASWFHVDMHAPIVLTRTIHANWKCLVENALETYHTTEVHPKTFGDSPDEEECEHQLEDGWSALKVDFSQERSFRTTLDKFGHWLTGGTREPFYRHIAHYPNVMIARLSLYRWVECVVPVTPNRSLSIVRLMCEIGAKGKLRRHWNRFLISRWANDFLGQVGEEDAAILAEMQAGLDAAEGPTGGLISTREERVFHFQSYVDQTLRQRQDTSRDTIPIRYRGNTP